MLLVIEQGDTKESTHCTQYETSVSQKTTFIHSTAREITTLHRKKHHLAEGWWIKMDQKVTKSRITCSTQIKHGIKATTETHSQRLIQLNCCQTDNLNPTTIQKMTLSLRTQTSWSTSSKKPPCHFRLMAKTMHQGRLFTQSQADARQEFYRSPSF